MKRLLLLFILLFSTQFSNAQEYQNSLLWEITGNGLTEPSYLYGTMHVSDRVAFNFSDLFFEKVQSTDAVALETNPEEWLPKLQRQDEYFYYPTSGTFYRNFYRKAPEKKQLANELTKSEQTIDWIFHRSNAFFEDYQEDTYLDMFIYYAGKRSNRPVYSLEDYYESNKLAVKASLAEEKDEESEWLKKQLKERNLNDLFKDAYREQNIMMFDSIYTALYSQDFIDNMLGIRNRNMVDSMHELMPRKSLFAAVGVAHLPGKEGMLRMLEEMGYTISPISGEYTEVGKSIKESIDESTTSVEYSKQSTSDGMVMMLAPSEFYEFPEASSSIHISLDMPNSAHLSVVRTGLRNYLHEEGNTITIEDLDSLHFEHIPGKINAKKQININGYDGWEISSTTKEGETYQIAQIITPMELITISFKGKEEYISSKPEIMKSIQLKEISNNWVTVSPIQKGFEVRVPANYTSLTDDQYTHHMASPQIEAYDAKTGSYYFVMNQTIHDIRLLEDSDFELYRIPYEYLKYNKLDTLNARQIDSTSYRTESMLKDSSLLSLKTIIDGPNYYLLGSTANATETNQFFDSFRLTTPDYFQENVTHVDSLLHFTVNTTLKTAQYEEKKYNNNQEFKFKRERLTRLFTSESNRVIQVEYNRSHRYETYEHIDSLWQEILESNQDRYSFNTEEYTTNTKDGWNRLNVIFKDTSNVQSVRADYWQNGQVIYSVKTLQEENGKSDEFVNEFYRSFQPKKDTSEMTLFSDKVPLFMEDIHSEADSIRNAAWDSIYELKFKDDHLPQLVQIIEEYEFEEDEEDNRLSVVYALADLKTKKSQDYLINLYRTTDNSSTQMAILRGLAEQENTNLYETILELMEEDLPLPSNYTIEALFNAFEEDTEHSKVMFPNLFNFYSIPEYKSGVISFTNTLLREGEIQPKRLKSFKKSMLLEAKLEYKRAKNMLYEDRINSYNQYRSSNIRLNELMDYLDFLSYFPQDNDIDSFLDKVKSNEDENLQLAIFERKVINENEDIEVYQPEDDKSIVKLYSILSINERFDLLSESLSEEDIALARIKTQIKFDDEEDEIEYLTTRELSFKEDRIRVLFFKTKKEKSYGAKSWNLAHVAFKIDEDGNLGEILEARSNQDFIEDDLDETAEQISNQILFQKFRRANFMFTDNYYYDYSY